MYRLFYEELKKWKENPNKPMMIVGARQIGKTYIINEFCKKEFDNYIYVNLMERNDIIEVFESKMSYEEKVKTLKLLLKRDILESTVIFFDEIQESEGLISSLKSFCEDNFPYKIICAGSLLGVKLKRFHSSFPVGKVVIKDMHSMNFLEFLINFESQEIIDEIRRCFDNNEKMEEHLHEKLLNYYRTYQYIGGMPESVLDYINSGCNIQEVNIDIIDSIYRSYIADMKKYISYESEAVKIERIYQSIPLQLARENKKFKYSTIDKGARKREYESSIDWLIASQIVTPVYNTKEFQTPIKAYMNYDSFKLYMNDLGLLNRICNTNVSDILLDKDFRYKGSLAENFVINELKANNIEAFYYSEKNMEIDAIIQSKIDGTVPVEIKAGKNNKSKSLNAFIEKNKIKLAYRISANNFGLSNGIKSIPLYATFCIK